MNPFTVVLLTILKMALCCSCQAENNQSHLIHHILMKNYDPLVRPVENVSQRLALNMSMGLKGFIELNMKKQTLVSFGWLTVTWYDEFLRWDLNQYPFQTIYLKADMVWRPDLIIFNTVNDLDQLETQKRKVAVESSGKVTWYPGGLFQTFCSVNIFHYPLDTQTCSVEVSTWLYTSDSLSTAFMDPAFETSEEMENHPEWTLVSETARQGLRYGNWQTYFSYTLKRKTTFYIFNMILPISLLSLMNCLVFLLPVESGEKMTVSVTMFLSLAVFLSVINDSLPPNSDSVCLFSVYVGVQMTLSICYIIMAACIVFIYQKDKVPCTKSCPLRPGMNSKTKNIKSSHSYTESTTECGTENSDGEDSVCSSKERCDGSESMKRVWLMLISVHRLTPEERRLLSQQLDKVCLKVSLVTNVIVSLVFGFIWMRT